RASVSTRQLSVPGRGFGAVALRSCLAQAPRSSSPRYRPRETYVGRDRTAHPQIRPKACTFAHRLEHHEGFKSDMKRPHTLQASLPGLRRILAHLLPVPAQAAIADCRSALAVIFARGAPCRRTLTLEVHFRPPASCERHEAEFFGQTAAADAAFVDLRIRVM